MKNFVLKTILLLIVFTGCGKKEYPQPVAAKASFFYCKLLVNGEPVEITTGKDNYYMYSSFTKDSSNIYNLIGEFKQTDCSNCRNSLRIQIMILNLRLQRTSGNRFGIKSKNYSFLSGVSDLNYISFLGTFNKSYSSVLWNFGGRNFFYRYQSNPWF